MNKNKNLVKKLSYLIGRELEIDGYSPSSQKSKIVAVAINNNEDDFCIGILPVDGAYAGETPNDLKEGTSWINILSDYGNIGLFWIDKSMVDNIKDLRFLDNL